MAPVCSVLHDILARLNRIEEHCSVTRRKVNVLDNKQRSNNIRVINIEESESENQEQLRVKVDKIIQKTGVQCNTIKAFRIGENRPPARGSMPNKPRPIIATLPSEEHRNNVLRSSHKLRSLQKGIFVQDDVCQDTVLERQKQMIRFKELKTQYQTVYFRGSTLKYKGRKQPQAQSQPSTQKFSHQFHNRRNQRESHQQPRKNGSNVRNSTDVNSNKRCPGINVKSKIDNTNDTSSINTSNNMTNGNNNTTKSSIDPTTCTNRISNEVLPQLVSTKQASNDQRKPQSMKSNESPLPGDSSSATAVDSSIAGPASPKLFSSVCAAEPSTGPISQQLKSTTSVPAIGSAVTNDATSVTSAEKSSVASALTVSPAVPTKQIRRSARNVRTKDYPERSL